MSPRLPDLTGLCVVEGCRTPYHSDGCTETGCVDHPPAIALPGLLACGHHLDGTRRRLVGDRGDTPPERRMPGLPELWEAIAEPRTGTRTGRGWGDDDGAAADEPPLGAGTSARTLIRAYLTQWTWILADPPPLGRSVTLPDEHAIAAATRRLTVYHQSDAEVAYAAYRAAQRAGDPHTAARHLTAASRHQAHAQHARDRRHAGRDILDALADHIDRHLTWILAHPAHAAAFVHDIHLLHRTARPLAYRAARSPVTIACTCGARVPIDPDRPTHTCPGCSEWGDLTWWRHTVAPTITGPLPLRELPDALLAVYGLTVTHRQLRAWRERGILHASPTTQTPDPAAGMPNPPLLYDVEVVAVVARAKLTKRNRAS